MQYKICAVFHTKLCGKFQVPNKMPLLFECVMLLAAVQLLVSFMDPPAVLWREEKLREINVDARTEPLRGGGGVGGSSHYVRV